MLKTLKVVFVVKNSRYEADKLVQTRNNFSSKFIWKQFNLRRRKLIPQQKTSRWRQDHMKATVNIFSVSWSLCSLCPLKRWNQISVYESENWPIWSSLLLTMPSNFFSCFNPHLSFVLGETKKTQNKQKLGREV